MTRTRTLLNTAGLIASALAVQVVVLQLWNLGVLSVELASERDAANLVSGQLFVSLLIAVLHCAAFGLGVFLALRFFAPIELEGAWLRTIGRGVIATASGAVVALAFNLVVSFLSAVTIGEFPFGYSLSAGVDPGKAQYGIWNSVGTAISPLIVWLPLTVLGVVLLKLWLDAHPVPVETTDRVSVAD